MNIQCNNTCWSSSGCQVILTVLLLLLIFGFIIFLCFQLEPDKDRCGFLTVPEEWKIVDDIMQQPEKGTHEKGTYTFKSCTFVHVVILIGMLIVSCTCMWSWVTTCSFQLCQFRPLHVKNKPKIISSILFLLIVRNRCQYFKISSELVY